MYHHSSPLLLYCETALHAGTGSELGVIDLPIQRERHTGFPKMESSGLKGALRERFEQKLIEKGEIKKDDKKREHPELYATFGPADGELHAGCLGFTDARLLCFPVKSMKGVFGWVTCPSILNRLADDFVNSGLDVPAVKPINEPGASGTELHIPGGQNAIVLEEYKFVLPVHPDITALATWLADAVFPGNNYWNAKMKSSLLVLNDDDFKDFVNLSTEVVTRTKINNETGTVENGALFTEEYLPAESILYSMVLFGPVLDKSREIRPSKLTDAKSVEDYFDELLEYSNNRFQAGGNATLGKGILRTSIVKPIKPSSN